MIKKIVLSIISIFTVAIASVIGFACFAPKNVYRGGALITA